MYFRSSFPKRFNQLSNDLLNLLTINKSIYLIKKKNNNKFKNFSHLVKHAVSLV